MDLPRFHFESSDNVRIKVGKKNRPINGGVKIELFKNSKKSSLIFKQVRFIKIYANCYFIFR